jgi:hypothetical protein
MAGRALSAPGDGALTGRLSFRGGRGATSIVVATMLSATGSLGGANSGEGLSISLRLASKALARSALAGSSSISSLLSSGTRVALSSAGWTFSSCFGWSLVSSTSSDISLSLCRWSEELEEFREAVEGRSMTDRASADSVNSEAVANEKTVSCGVKVSRTA